MSFVLLKQDGITAKPTLVGSTRGGAIGTYALPAYGKKPQLKDTPTATLGGTGLRTLHHKAPLGPKAPTGASTTLRRKRPSTTAVEDGGDEATGHHDGSGSAAADHHAVTNGIKNNILSKNSADVEIDDDLIRPLDGSKHFIPKYPAPVPNLEDLGKELNHVSKFKLPLKLEQLLPAQAVPWYRKLRYLADNEDLDDFYYLTPTKDYRTDDDYNPYELVICEHHQVDKNNYYTLSAHGVTHILGEGADCDYWTLSGFEREFFLFLSFRQFKIFRHYKSWWFFARWRALVKARKIHKAKATLEQKLFLVQPVYQDVLQQVGEACQELEEIPMTPLSKSSSIRAMNDLRDVQRSMSAEAKTRIQLMLDDLEDLTFDACETVLSFTDPLARNEVMSRLGFPAETKTDASWSRHQSLPGTAPGQHKAPGEGMLLSTYMSSRLGSTFSGSFWE